MNASTKAITILASVLFSATLLFSSVAQARPRRSRPRSVPARTRSGRRDRGSRHGLTLSVGLGQAFGNTSSRRWVPGHNQTRTEQVLVEPGHHEWHEQSVLVEPGHYEMHHIPAVEKIIRDSRGRAHKVVTRPACTEKVWVPAQYEMRQVKIYVPARYETRQVRVWVPGYWVSQPVRSPVRSYLNLGALFNFRF